MSVPQPSDAPRTGRRRSRFAQQIQDQTRQAVLNAVADLIAERSWSEITMSDVAKRAGVTRQMIYTLFGSRDELAGAYVLREADRLVGGVEAAMAGREDDAECALRDGLEVFFTDAIAHPLMRAITGVGSDELLSLFTTHGLPVLTLASQRLVAAITHHWPEAALDDAELLVENAVRLAISHAGLSSGTPAETAASLSRLLNPFVRQALNHSTRT
ncbi:TetR family transcriptional regulator [Actinocorallia lasiicapitis]